MRKIMIKFCDFLEKKLYDEPTFSELTIALDRTRHRLFEARAEIDNLQAVIVQILCNR